MAYLNVVKVEDALKQLQQRFQNFEPKTEWIPLDKALGRTLSEDLSAPENLPSFKRSMVDGYAVIASDTYGASEQSPMILPCVGQVEMGKSPAQKLSSGVCVMVPTGGEVPEGADAMIMIEHTEALGEDIAIYGTVAVSENITDIGDDVLKGTILLEKGTRLEPQHFGVLASMGVHTVPVTKPVQVAILSTGDELVDITAKPVYGQVRDCNAILIRQIITASGAEVAFENRVCDQLEQLINAIAEAMKFADVVLLSGGSSAGTKDLTQIAIDSFPNPSSVPNVFIHGLAIKPGKPTIIGQVDDKAIIGLPGHPAACFTTMKALVEPFVRALSHTREKQIKAVACEAMFQLHAAGGRDVYQLVAVRFEEGKFKAYILHGKSGMVSALAQANAYVIIPMNHEGIKKGDQLLAYHL